MHAGLAISRRARPGTAGAPAAPVPVAAAPRAARGHALTGSGALAAAPAPGPDLIPAAFDQPMAPTAPPPARPAADPRAAPAPAPGAANGAPSAGAAAGLGAQIAADAISDHPERWDVLSNASRASSAVAPLPAFDRRLERVRSFPVRASAEAVRTHARARVALLCARARVRVACLLAPASRTSNGRCGVRQRVRQVTGEPWAPCGGGCWLRLLSCWVLKPFIALDKST